MYEYYNPHPKGKNVGDCVKRAVCKAMNMDYMDVQRMLNRIKNDIGAKDFRRLSVRVELARREGWGHIVYDKWGDDSMMDAETFQKEHPKGTYILNMKRHCVACVDGMLYDTWDSSKRGVSDVWVIKED